MSNERSPREVCSITMGINGLMSGWLLATGGPQFRLGGWLFLVGCPDGFAGGGLLGRGPVALLGDRVRRAGQQHGIAPRVRRARPAGLPDGLRRCLDAIA